MLLCSNPEQQGAESNTLVRSVGICLLFKAIFILYKLPAMKNTWVVKSSAYLYSVSKYSSYVYDYWLNITLLSKYK